MHLSRRKTAFGPSDAVVGEKSQVFGLGQGTQTPEGPDWLTGSPVTPPPKAMARIPPRTLLHPPHPPPIQEASKSAQSNTQHEPNS
jgi:hypothetical protein